MPKTATGPSYSNLVAAYIQQNFSGRNITVYREVPLSKTVIGKKRVVDLFLIEEDTKRAFAIECKFQNVSGTADEKIIYSLENMAALRNSIPGCLVYAGEGWSKGILHLLEASPFAAYW